MGRSSATLCIPLLALASVVHAAGASMNCDRPSRCPDPAIIATAQALVDAACPCPAATAVRAYRRCWQREMRAHVQAVGFLGFPKACQAEMRQRLNTSLCGRVGFVLCRGTNAKDEVLCRTRKDSRCSDAFPPAS